MKDKKIINLESQLRIALQSEKNINDIKTKLEEAMQSNEIKNEISINDL